MLIVLCVAGVIVFIKAMAIVITEFRKLYKQEQSLKNKNDVD